MSVKTNAKPKNAPNAAPARMTLAETMSTLEKAGSAQARIRMCLGYVGSVAAESPHAAAKAAQWLAKKEGPERCCAWSLVGIVAMRDEKLPDAWFVERLADIQRTIHASPNGERDAM